jgi:steroid Delta-isomerase
LAVYAEDAVLEDPVGPSMFDPTGAGHHGHQGLTAFWEKAIAAVATFEFSSPSPTLRQPGQQHLRQHRPK